MDVVTLKEKRYDRQLRLWKAHGQKCLELAKILVIGSNPVACEILKNLVLPGIGGFDIIDQSLITESDLSNNFFLEPKPENLGESRAELVLPQLCSLNSGVRGKVLSGFLDSVCELVDEYDAIVCALDSKDFPPKLFDKLAETCWNKAVLFLHIRVNGAIGMVRFQLPQVLVAETHADFVQDLRFDCPWPELQLLTRESLSKFAEMSAHEMSHVPAILLILCATVATGILQKTPPVAVVKQTLREWLLSAKNGRDFGNFDDAFSLVNRWDYYSLPPNVKHAFSDPKCQTEKTAVESGSMEWVAVWAIKQFYEKHGVLPLMGTIPDMTADTQSYVILAETYREKAKRDFSEILSLIEATNCAVDEELIRRMCANAQTLTLKRYTSIEKERQTCPASIARVLAAEKDSPLVFYPLFAAEAMFFKEFGRFPGQDATFDYSQDVILFRKVLNKLLSAWNLPSLLVPNDYVQEFVRAGHSSLSTVSALIGGVASQEILKVITKQYIPMPDLFMFNGVSCTSCQHEFL